MARQGLMCLCICMMAMRSYGQLLIKNSNSETIVTVSQQGKMEIADSMIVKALANSSGSESSLVGVNKNGTLIKSNLSLLNQALVFVPVNDALLLKKHNISPNNADTMNAALDVAGLTGITLPTEATHILVHYRIDFNLKYPTSAGEYNAQLFLFLDDVMPADNWSGGAAHQLGYITFIDGATTTDVYSTIMDHYEAAEQQDSGYQIVQLSDNKTIAYRLRTNYTSTLTGTRKSDVFNTIALRLIVAGYYVPISTLLKP
jgi:hypothetical protein